jgi:hypothetical protein
LRCDAALSQCARRLCAVQGDCPAGTTCRGGRCAVD